MKHVIPEERGLASEYILEYIQALEEKNLSTHNLLIVRGDDILFEKYWEPFQPDFLHRMYSISKSFVAIAIGFAEQDGLLALDDKIEKYFAKELKNQNDENMKKQSIRHMLMMSTAKPTRSWFKPRVEDRVLQYFENNLGDTRPSGTIFQYDSTGCFALGALVERLTGKSLMDYLREKLFDIIGVSKEAYCLKCPGGHSWGDSGILCKPIDIVKVAKFMMNKGKWNGEQILNEKFVVDATSKLIDTNDWGMEEYNTQGYGYYIWRTYQDSFSFNGMGSQFAICVPHKDLILVYNGDNQGNPYANRTIFDKFFELVVDNIQDNAVAVDSTKQKELATYTNDLKLAVAKGASHSPYENLVNGATYYFGQNCMGIEKIKLTFHDNKGCMSYTNEQGDKTIEFGMEENVFGEFPQEGYSREVGSVATKDFYYKSATSAAWIEPHKLFIKVQVIDTYFGKLNIILSFQGNKVEMVMNKCAEDFFNEYVGSAEGHC